MSAKRMGVLTLTLCLTQPVAAGQLVTATVYDRGEQRALPTYYVTSQAIQGTRIRFRYAITTPRKFLQLFRWMVSTRSPAKSRTGTRAAT